MLHNLTFGPIFASHHQPGGKTYVSSWEGPMKPEEQVGDLTYEHRRQ